MNKSHPMNPHPQSEFAPQPRVKSASSLKYRRNLTVSVEGMDCSDCALAIEHILARMEGILDVNVSYASQSVHIAYDTRLTNRWVIQQLISHLGYTVPNRGLFGSLQKQQKLLLSVLAGIILWFVWASDKALVLSPGIRGVAYLPIYILAGYFPFRNALASLRRRDLDTDLLMILAALGAAILGEFAEGGFLLVLFSLGHALEDFALQRTQQSITSLAKLSPRTALMKRNGVPVETPVEQVNIGDVLLVRPGGLIPVDGQVEAGISSVDQSPLTGESFPVKKAPGDQVYAGSINGEGLLEIRVTRLARDSTLARIIKAIERARMSKSRLQQITDKFIRIFLPTILIVDLGMILVPWILGEPFHTAFMRAMTILVAASPCALALGGPAATLSALTAAARNGVLIKGSAHLENLGALRALAFDKTGTLTTGQLDVIDVISFEPLKWDSEELLAMCAGLEVYSGHPLAQAIVRAAHSRNLKLPDVSQVSEEPGNGIQGQINGLTLKIGQPQWIMGESSTLPHDLLDKINHFESQGKTIMLIALDDKPVGLLTLADSLRPGSVQAIQRLKEMGLKRIILLSGDNHQNAERVAAQTNLEELRSGLTPDGKLSAIEGLIAHYGAVGMVGDGINDAPSLAHATVGIAIGGAKTDTAIETADAVLMADDLTLLPYMITLGRATRSIVRQNILIAGGVMILLALLALIGSANIGLTVVIHEGSTLLVIFNGLRLLGLNARA